MGNPQTLGDLYEELGVPRDATRDQLAAAFRTRAKEFHPDARPGDAAAAERFKRVGTAYRTLSDPVERARYDSAASAASPAVEPTQGQHGRPRGSSRLSRRGARWAVGGGALLVVLGLAAGVFVVSLQRHDADLRASGVATVATVVQVGGERRLEFTTSTGRIVRAVERVKSGEEQPAVSARVPIHYDRRDPTNIVTDDSHAGRNITLWIVAVKFVVGGGLLVWFGSRRLRRTG